MNLLGVVAVAALALLPLSARATPLTEPLVFDFEDGFQGWEVFGSAQRVQTQLLGGEWAIFGDGFLGAALLSPLGSVERSSFTVTFDVLVIEGGGVPTVFDSPTDSPVSPVNIAWLSPFNASDGGGFMVAFIDNITFHPVPEPSTLALLLLGLTAMAVGRVR